MTLEILNKSFKAAFALCVLASLLLHNDFGGNTLVNNIWRGSEGRLLQIRVHGCDKQIGQFHKGAKGLAAFPSLCCASFLLSFAFDRLQAKSCANSRKSKEQHQRVKDHITWMHSSASRTASDRTTDNNEKTVIYPRCHRSLLHLHKHSGCLTIAPSVTRHCRLPQFVTRAQLCAVAPHISSAIRRHSALQNAAVLSLSS